MRRKACGQAYAVRRIAGACRSTPTLEAMIFAFATDERTLMIFPNESDAVSYCEGWDVSEGGWLFFAADGSPMEAVFSEPTSKNGWVISHGFYSLRISADSEKTQLLALLPQVAAVEGEAPFNTVTAIEGLLTSRLSGMADCGLRPPAAALQLQR